MHFSISAATAATLLMAGTTLATPVAAPSAPDSNVVLGTVLTEAEVNARAALPGAGNDGPLVFTAVGGLETSAEKRSYLGTCSQCYVDTWLDQIALYCSCPDKAGKNALSVLALGSCLANSNGQLVWRRSGNFQDSCRGQQLRDGKMFKSECLNNAKVRAWTREINLEERIHNYNGALGCNF